MSGAFTQSAVPRLGMGQSVPGGDRMGFDLLPIHNESAPSTFGNVGPMRITKAGDNTSTMHHARQPYNVTYLVDIDQSNLPIAYKESSSAAPDRMTPARPGEDSTTISNGEMNKEDVVCMRRLSSHRNGLSYAIKNIGSMNMYLRSNEGRRVYGTERHCGKLLEDWDIACMVQVGNIYKKNFQKYTAYSAVFSVSGNATILNTYLACEFEQWHKDTHRTVNENDYVGHALIRMRYEDTAAEMASPYDVLCKKRARHAYHNERDSDYFKRTRGSNYIDPFVHPDYVNLPHHIKYNYKDVEEELNHEHFWQIVPYVSSLPSGPYQDFIENQHFYGAIKPLGPVWETYGDNILPNRERAEHALYYTFPWLEDASGDWRERSLHHRAEIKSNLSVHLGVNSRRLYIP